MTRALYQNLAWVLANGAMKYCLNLLGMSSTFTRGCVKASAHKILDICSEKKKRVLHR